MLKLNVNEEIIIKIDEYIYCNSVIVVISRELTIAIISSPQHDEDVLKKRDESDGVKD